MKKILLGSALILSVSLINSARADWRAAVTIADGIFASQSITVPAGTTVTWSNVGRDPHTVTSDNGYFDSGVIIPGNGSFTWTFSSPGTYPYYCRFHGGPGGIGMSGTVVVTTPSAYPYQYSSPSPAYSYYPTNYQTYSYPYIGSSPAYSYYPANYQQSYPYASTASYPYSYPNSYLANTNYSYPSPAYNPYPYSPPVSGVGYVTPAAAYYGYSPSTYSYPTYTNNYNGYNYPYNQAYYPYGYPNYVRY